MLVIVKPNTVIGWHRTGIRVYWRWRSRPVCVQPKISEELRILIRRLAQENEGWGAPKSHGELLRLRFVVTERTVARYLRRIRRRRGEKIARLVALATFLSASLPMKPIRGGSVEVNTFLLFCPFVSGTGKRVGAAQAGRWFSGGDAHEIFRVLNSPSVIMIGSDASRRRNWPAPGIRYNIFERPGGLSRIRGQSGRDAIGSRGCDRSRGDGKQ
jgi:hypothetical protein